MLPAKLMWSLAQWMEYHTGDMVYGNQFYGILEANYTLALFSILTWFVGSDTWHEEVNLSGVPPVRWAVDVVLGKGKALLWLDVVFVGIIGSCK